MVCKRGRSLNVLNPASAAAAGGGGGLLEGGGTWDTIGVDTATSRGTRILDGPAANTKGDYVELEASTSADAVGLLINVSRPNDNNVRFAFDIALGAAASEVVLIADLGFRTDARQQTSFNIFIPCNIPAGSRVSARCQSILSTSSFDVSCMLLIGSSATATVTDTLNFDSAQSGGDFVDLGPVSANVKTAYLELNASTSEAYTSVILIVVPFLASATDSTMLLDLATGAAASETDVLSNIAFSIDASADMDMIQIGPIPLNVAAGSRLSARLQGSVAGAGDGVRIQVLGVQ